MTPVRADVLHVNFHEPGGGLDASAISSDLDDMAELLDLLRPLIAQVCSFAAQLERQAIARRTRAGLERARAEGKRLGRSPALAEETLSAVRQDLAEGQPVAAVARKYQIPRTTLIGYLERSAGNG